jgi:5-methylthioadenosine/S-adenosylhomocysteine deaminase
MCILCQKGNFQKHFSSRRNFLKGAAATGFAASALKLFAPRPAAAQYSDVPLNTGVPGRRYVIRGGSVMSMDPRVGDFPKTDVLV